MKYTITEQQYKKLFLIEGSESEAQIQEKLKTLKTTQEVNTYFNELNQEYASQSDKLVLIFPGYGQYSVVATAIFLGRINAQVFTSINDCIEVINSLANKGKKYSQIYIGSHGGGREGLLTTIDEPESATIFGPFADALKSIRIAGQTRIIFSACSGADYPGGYFMKGIAEELDCYKIGRAHV